MTAVAQLTAQAPDSKSDDLIADFNRIEEIAAPPTAPKTPKDPTAAERQRRRRRAKRDTATDITGVTCDNRDSRDTELLFNRKEATNS